MFGTLLECLVQHVHGAVAVATGNERREALSQFRIIWMLLAEA